jgi:hypothetical protein
MTQQPKPFAKVSNQAALKVLIDHVHNLEYPLPGGTQWIKNPYFQERFAANQEGVREVKRRFCEAIVLLFEKHDLLKKPPGRPRKDADD